MIICDRCKHSQKNMRQCRMGMWYEKILQGDYGDYWTEKRGDQHEMTLCTSCFDALSKKIISTIEQDEIQPAYSLPPRRSLSLAWFKIILESFLIGGGVFGVLKWLNWANHLR